MFSCEFCRIFKNTSGRLLLASSPLFFLLWIPTRFMLTYSLYSRFRLSGWKDLRKDIEKTSTTYIRFHISEKPLGGFNYFSIRDKYNARLYLIHFLQNLTNKTEFIFKSKQNSASSSSAWLFPFIEFFLEAKLLFQRDEIHNYFNGYIFCL